MRRVALFPLALCLLLGTAHADGIVSLEQALKAAVLRDLPEAYKGLGIQEGDVQKGDPLSHMESVFGWEIQKGKVHLKGKAHLDSGFVEIPTGLFSKSRELSYSPVSATITWRNDYAKDLETRHMA